MVNESPVYFTRTHSMRPLPMPVAHSDVGLLWQHTNIPVHSRVMVLAWLLDCFRPDTPFPVLELVGEQGSAKSTTQSVLRSLVDPNKVMLRGRPKTVEDVFVAAANNWLVSYENLSGLTPEQQDAFAPWPLVVALPRASSTPMAKSTSWKPSGRWCSTASPWSPRDPT